MLLLCWYVFYMFSAAPSHSRHSFLLHTSCFPARTGLVFYLVALGAREGGVVNRGEWW